MARGTTNNSSKRKTVSYTKWGYIFVAPFVVVYLIFSLYPLLNTFIYSAANMTSTTSEFWGFSDKEVYYDRYLNLNDLYTDNFDERTGVDSVTYKRLREYFDVFQTNADKYNPLKKSGVEAIVNYANNPASNDTPYSVEAANAVKSAMDNQDFSLILPYYDELTNWSANYKNETLLNIATLRSVNDSCEKITTTELGENLPVADDILSSDNFINFVDSLESTEFNVAQAALLDYCSSYITEKMGTSYTVAEFFKAVQDGTISLDEPTVYKVCTILNKTDIDFAEDGAEEKVSSKIEVPFYSNLENFLIANSWQEAINSNTSVSRFADYISGEKDLHSDEDQLIEDLKTLNDMGVVNLVALVRDGDSIKASEDYLDNKIVAFEKYRDEKTVDNEYGSLAAMQLSDIQRFYNGTERNVSKFEDKDINIYAMISYNGEMNIERYKEVKTKLGLNDCLSLAAYQQLDATRKAENVEKAQKDLAEQQAKLPEVQAAYEAAKATGDEKTIEDAYNKLRAVEIAIDDDNDVIKNPTGILTKVNAQKQYIMVGLENYKTIFANKTRFNMVSGALVATAILWLIGFAPQILLALILSAWFTDTKIKLKGLNLMKALMYLPNVITAVTVAIFFRNIFAYSTSGTFSASQLFLRGIGVEKGYNFFDNAWATRFIVAFINFWMWYGNTMITLIAGISSISTSLYEAAQIDGANSFQTYTKITMPLLRPMLLYTMVTSMIGGLQMFDVPQNINRNSKLINFNGTMIPSIRTIMMYINNQAFSVGIKQQVGVGSAVAVLLFILTTILSILIFYMMRDKDVAKAKKLAKKAKKGEA